jgi:hypothetical protein
MLNRTCKISNLSKEESKVIRQTVEEYIKERYGKNMGYEKICPICEEHYDAGEKCDCQERRKRAVQLIKERLANGESCIMNIVTMDHVYFENTHLKFGNDGSLEVVCDDNAISLDLDAVLEAK